MTYAINEFIRGDLKKGKNLIIKVFGLRNVELCQKAKMKQGLKDKL